MGQASLTGVRRKVRVRYLDWRTAWERDTAVGHLETLALALERRGWRCVRTYEPEIVQVRLPLLRVYGGEMAVTLCVLALPGGAWGLHEAARGRSGLLCLCGGEAAEVVDGFLRCRSRA
ncbi:hypothetical protein [Actinomadura chibensis]|uniref:Uncharacterized protein n=1 Tax=Actinomadura chibensis TaxID=392828 RepID=A0A5D0NEW6_9ACTN|nr:hypothetical protein [Actinomadura chibensis]TYB42907.1 hypothetical protein FXF69_29515 [Actinomadura chibensis]